MLKAFLIATALILGASNPTVGVLLRELPPPLPANVASTDLFGMNEPCTSNVQVGDPVRLEIVGSELPAWKSLEVFIRYDTMYISQQSILIPLQNSTTTARSLVRTRESDSVRRLVIKVVQSQEKETNELICSVLMNALRPGRTSVSIDGITILTASGTKVVLSKVSTDILNIRLKDQ